MVAMKWVGTSVLRGKLGALAAKAPTALGAVLYIEGQRILTTSAPLVPVEFGTLRASGYVTEPKISMTGAEVTIGYGGAAKEYAWFVHEILTNYHKPPTQAKYLEQPVLEAQRGLASRLGVGLRLMT